jgi:hypothetical protein
MSVCVSVCMGVCGVDAGVFVLRGCICVGFGVCVGRFVCRCDCACVWVWIDMWECGCGCVRVYVGMRVCGAL